MRDVFDVLAEPTRRAILDRLRRPDGCLVGELVASLGLSQPTVSKHLRVLRETGMVDVAVESQQRRYLLRPEALVPLETWLAPHRAFWEERFDALGTHLDALHDRGTHDHDHATHDADADTDADLDSPRREDPP